MRHPLIYIPTPGGESEYHLPPIRLAGYVGWKLIRHGKVIQESPMQKNLLVNAGFDDLGAGNGYASGMYAAAGTGSNVPAGTDTSLQTEITAGGRRFQGAATTGYVAIGGAVTQDYWWRKIIFTFTETQANGNLTEFGTFTGGGTLLARQLFKDVGGTPTTIIKTNVDQLEVTYEYRCYPPIVDQVLTAFAISGDAITSDITIRPQLVSASTWLDPLTGTPIYGGSVTAVEDSTIAARTSTNSSSPNAGSSSSVFSTYTIGNFYIDETIKFEPAVANFTTGIGLLKLYTYAGGALYQASFATKIPKTSIKRTTIVIRRSWARFP